MKSSHSWMHYCYLRNVLVSYERACKKKNTCLALCGSYSCALFPSKLFCHVLIQPGGPYQVQFLSITFPRLKKLWVKWISVLYCTIPGILICTATYWDNGLRNNMVWNKEWQISPDELYLLILEVTPFTCLSQNKTNKITLKTLACHIPGVFTNDHGNTYNGKNLTRTSKTAPKIYNSISLNTF